MAVGDQRVPLTFIGASRSLREQALPLAFRAQGAALDSWPSASRCACSCRPRTRSRASPVPVASLMKNPANQTIVWVKTAPERFEPRTVTTEPLDGVSVAVTSGPEAGRPGRDARRHLDQPGALRTPCSSGSSTTAWPTGCW